MLDDSCTSEILIAPVKNCTPGAPRGPGPWPFARARSVRPRDRGCRRTHQRSMTEAAATEEAPEEVRRRRSKTAPVLDAHLGLALFSSFGTEPGRGFFPGASTRRPRASPDVFAPRHALTLAIPHERALAPHRPSSGRRRGGHRQESIDAVLANAPYKHAFVGQWTNDVVETCVKRLAGLNKPFKYVVTCVIMQRNGAGLHTAASCFWDNDTDGSRDGPVGEQEHVLRRDGWFGVVNEDNSDPTSLSQSTQRVAVAAMATGRAAAEGDHEGGPVVARGLRGEETQGVRALVRRGLARQFKDLAPNPVPVDRTTPWSCAARRPRGAPVAPAEATRAR